ncbi:phage tail terminator protein [Tianweitania sediminis]|uniref:Uncharacterized protein n=1 Tax=Tianweitania sediminis TaxID=1502156 RepID=A0A8J7RJ70_9HYPH|nr:hypothetical protein [Tianweitania sediminis]MBP0439436.1 hypothetical protein [Tianweitania sediminis]
MSSLVDVVIARLRDTSGSPFRLVEPIAELAALKDGPNTTPAAFVVILEEVAGESERLTGPVLQPVEVDLGVYIVTSNVSDATGGAAAGEIDSLKAWVRQQMIGFAPNAEHGEPFTLIAGKLVRAAKGSVWWGETYGVTTWLEQQA